MPVSPPATPAVRGPSYEGAPGEYRADRDPAGPKPAGRGSADEQSYTGSGGPAPGHRAQRTNSWPAAWLARLSSGCGTMPNTSVAAAPTATAAEVNRLGVTTEGAPGAGSEKNMSTMMRT